MEKTKSSFFDEPSFWKEERFQSLEFDRARKIIDLLPSDIASVLDVGCGNGIVTGQIPGRIWKVGLDLSRAALTYLRVPAVQASAVQLPFKNNTFDLLICTEVLEHIPYREFPVILSELARVTRRYILLAVPFQEDLNLSSTSCPVCGCVFHVYHHVRSFRRENLIDLFNKTGHVTLINIQKILPENVPIFLGVIRKFIRLSFPWHTICPQCGYYTDSRPLVHQKWRPSNKRDQVISGIKYFWPQQKHYRWWLALYLKY